MTQIETRIKLLLLTVFVVACGGPGGNSLLAINASSNAFLIPFGDLVFPEGDSCYSGQTISAPRFTISKITTTWKGDGNFRPNFIKLDVNATGNSAKYTCTYTSSGNDDSIAQALGFPQSEVNRQGAVSVSADSICSVRCSSFTINNKNAPLTATGTIRLYGIQTKTVNGQTVEVAVSAQDSFVLQYTP